MVVSTCTNDKCKLWGSSIPNLVLEALTQAKQDLKQSERCCSAWKTQAVDYKEAAIALSSMLEITRKALEIARYAITDVFGYVKEHEKDIGGCAVNIVIKLGIALGQIDHFADASKMIEHKEQRDESIRSNIDD